MAFLRILLNGREYRRELGESTIIGRDAECDLRVDDPKISRVHCVIQRTGEGWLAADLDSHNGTLLGGWPLTRQPLKHGDVLKLGAASLQFLAEEDARLAAAALELANQPPAGSTSETAPLSNSTAPSPATLLTPTRKKSLWEKATHSSTVEPSRSKKRKRKTIDLEKLRAQNKKSPAPGAGPIDLTKVAQPWYYRSVPLAIAIPASLAFLLVIYFLANGFPRFSGSQSKPIPASVSHSSPYNND
jgi:pSer/pThr/pTyr-binding forkhead associated (FHA) protein